jgi:hypothetical protein
MDTVILRHVDGSDYQQSAWINHWAVACRRDSMPTRRQRQFHTVRARGVEAAGGVGSPGSNGCWPSADSSTQASWRPVAHSRQDHKLEIGNLDGEEFASKYGLSRSISTTAKGSSPLRSVRSRVRKPDRDRSAAQDPGQAVVEVHAAGVLSE